MTRDEIIEALKSLAISIPIVYPEHAAVHEAIKLLQDDDLRPTEDELALYGRGKPMDLDELRRKSE